MNELLTSEDKVNVCNDETSIYVSEYEAFVELKSLNSNKSPGPDEVYSWLLKDFQRQ